MKRTWIRLFIDQTLKGSMISELNPEQRWMFIGLLLLAGDSSIPGQIFGRKDEDGNLIGYANGWLAYTLGVEEAHVQPALDRMKEKTKISVDERGVISICNWTKYQSEYLRQKPYRHQGDEAGDKGSDVADRDRDRDRDREEEGVVGQDALTKAQDMLQKWNKFAAGHELPPVRAIARGSSRERVVFARLREEDFNFEDVLKAIHEQEFLQGDNERGWLVTFDWILKPANMVKILERAYIKDVRGRARDRQPDDPKVGGRR